MTTATSEHRSPDTTDGGAIRPPRRGGARPVRLAALLVLAALVGLSVGRFLFLDPSSSVAGPAGPRPQSLEAVIAGLEQTVEATPEDLASWQQLGIGYTNRAIQVGDPAFYDLAGRAFDRADEIAPDDPDTLLGRGKLQLSLHEFSDALETGQAAVTARPDSAASLGVLVDAQVELGRYDEAADTLQRMLDRSPDLQSLPRASYLRELYGDLGGALTAMRQAEAAGSDAPLDMATVAALIGDLHLRLGEIDLARAAYERALADVPDLPAAVAGLARADVADGDVDGAIERLGPLAERLPIPTVVVLQTELLRLAGREDEAAQTDEVARAVATLSQSVGQVVDLEMALFEATRGTDPQAAIALGEKAYEARPDNVFVNDALGWALHRAGRTAEAVPYVDRGLRLGTRHAGMLARAALVYDAAGDTAGARTALERAFSLPPWHALPERAPATALGERLGVPVPPAWAGA